MKLLKKMLFGCSAASPSGDERGGPAKMDRADTDKYPHGNRYGTGYHQLHGVREDFVVLGRSSLGEVGAVFMCGGTFISWLNLGVLGEIAPNNNLFLGQGE